MVGTIWGKYFGKRANFAPSRKPGIQARVGLPLQLQHEIEFVFPYVFRIIQSPLDIDVMAANASKTFESKIVD